MTKLLCILTFFSMCFSDVLCRSINIDFSHKFNIAIDDYEEQESVDLKELKLKIRNELEKNVKQYQEQLKVVNFEIPANETDADNDIKNPSILGVAVPETTHNTNRFIIDTLLQPPEDRVKRSAKNPGFETLQKPRKDPKAVVAEVKKVLLNKILICVGFGVAALFIVYVVCICCRLIGPRNCFIALLTSPCCLIACPCVFSHIKKFLSPETVLRENTLAYMPGITVLENGKLQKYTPSHEEIEAVRDIIEIVKQLKNLE